MVYFDTSTAATRKLLLPIVVDFPDVEIFADAFLNTWEESRIELLITIVSSLPTTIRSVEMVALELLVVWLIKVGIASHSVARCHAIRLLALKRTSIGSIVLLALIEKVLCNCLVHTLSSNKSTTLGNQVFVLILVVAANYFTVGHHLLRVYVVGYHIYCGAKFFLYSLS